MCHRAISYAWPLKRDQIKESPIKYFFELLIKKKENKKRVFIFSFNICLEAWTKIFQKIVGILVKMITPKGHFKMN